MLHQNNHAFNACDQIHRTAHAFDHFARNHPVGDVAILRNLHRAQNRQIANDAAFQDIGLSIEIACFLAFRNNGADAGFGLESGNARAARAHAFRQSALRIEFDFQFAGQKQFGEKLVFADVRGKHLLDLPLLHQFSETETIHARIVADQSQSGNACEVDRLNAMFWDSAKTETACGDRHVVFQKTRQSLNAVLIYFAHTETLLPI